MASVGRGAAALWKGGRTLGWPLASCDCVCAVHAKGDIWHDGDLGCTAYGRLVVKFGR